MTDVLDAGTDLAERDRQGAWQERQLAEQQNAAKLAAFGTALDCHGCGETIPAERRAAVRGCTRCIQCETRDEHLRQMQRR